MKIISWNVNGIRAIERKGYLKIFLETYDPDVFLIQEIKGQQNLIEANLGDYSNYQKFYNSALKPGYSGTAIWVKKSTITTYDLAGNLAFDKGLVTEKTTDNLFILDDHLHLIDIEGRFARLSFSVDHQIYQIISVYVPNGGKSHDAWLGKIKYYQDLLITLNHFKAQGHCVILAGDVNCAHQEIDLARPKENVNSIGFLPEEKNALSEIINAGFVDVFRVFSPDQIVYSWWDQVTRARERNVGWRIDAFYVDQKYLPQIVKIDYLNEQFGSDHCPVFLEMTI